MEYYLYILTTKHNKLFYIGTTNNLVRRMFEHKNGLSKFTARYNVTKLVYYEVYDSIINAAEREKQLKNWRHDWKRNLVVSTNPTLRDLSDEIYS